MRSVVWAGDYPVTQPYGCTDLAVEPYDPRCVSKHCHCGVDIGMPSGTPLRAARGGWVKQVSWGLVAISIPGAAETDYYIHIDSVANAVVVGAKITQGQPIALSGAKIPLGGSLTGPHLHFEVQRGALNVPITSVDPTPILTGGYMAGTIGAEPWTTQGQAQNWLTDIRKTQMAEVGTADTANLPVTLPALMAAVKAQGGPGGAVDLSPVLDAIAALKAEVDGLVTQVTALSKHLGVGTP